MTLSRTTDLLEGLAPGMVTNRVLPLAVVIQVLRAQIEQNQPDRLAYSEAILGWITYRGENLTLEQGAWLWENCTQQFRKDMYKFFSQRRESRNTEGLLSTVGIARMYTNLVKAHVFYPWRDRLQKTLGGRVLFSLCGGMAFVFLALISLVLGSVAGALGLGLVHFIGKLAG